ncbi:hypothetical protein CUMW_242370, partial [Citrus unshiu]
MARLSWSSIALVLFLSVVFAVEVANAGGEGSLKPEQCESACNYRCSATSHRNPCIEFCNMCCKKCLCVPSGTYGHKEECPCYNNWKTKEGTPKSTSNEQCLHYQKLLMEENQKNKALSEEVETLQKLLQEGTASSSKDDNNDNMQLYTPEGAQPTSGNQSKEKTRKRRRKLGSGGENDSGPANCLFQALIEYLFGMKLSPYHESEGRCVSALHQSTGYSFSLTWVKSKDGEEFELLYRVLSLGTLERVALGWMMDEIMFSTTNPLFGSSNERRHRIFRLIGYWAISESDSNLGLSVPAEKDHLNLSSVSQLVTTGVRQLRTGSHACSSATSAATNACVYLQALTGTKKNVHATTNGRQRKENLNVL